MVAESILAGVKRYLEEVRQAGIPVEFGVIFGSQVKGRAGEWSDIDIVVVSPRFEGRHVYADVIKLWHAAGRVDSRIEPLACGLKEWEDEEIPILTVAKREGVKIAA